jgi:hypothetical protein
MEKPQLAYHEEEQNFLSSNDAAFDDAFDEAMEAQSAPSPVVPKPETEELKSFRERWLRELRTHRPSAAPSLSASAEQSERDSGTKRQSSAAAGVRRKPASYREFPANVDGSDELLALFSAQWESSSEPISASPSIQWLPPEILLRILRYFDVATVDLLSRVCKQWFIVARDGALWKKVCLYTWPETDPVHFQDYGCNWRRMYVERPRLRQEGMYISKNSYLRPGVTEGSFYQPVFRVTYYRYLRFFPDGSVLAYMGPEEPKDVADWLRPDKVDRKGKPFQAGVYGLEEDHVQAHLRSTNLQRTVFEMHLKVQSTGTRKSNCLSMEQYRCGREGQAATPLTIEVNRFFFAKLPPHLL